MREGRKEGGKEERKTRKKERLEEVGRKEGWRKKESAKGYIQL